jgi:hypothetical protein
MPGWHIDNEAFDLAVYHLVKCFRHLGMVASRDERGPHLPGKWEEVRGASLLRLHFLKLSQLKQ